MTNFQFICFDNLSLLLPNEFENLECEINNSNYYKYLHNFEIIHRYNQNQKKKIFYSNLYNSFINLENKLNIFYNDINEFKIYINKNLYYTNMY
tara:strand:+ start:97 stop:378 length:282 start_codon:yes stop_codon:yes gene_type:complete